MYKKNENVIKDSRARIFELYTDNDATQFDNVLMPRDDWFIKISVSMNIFANVSVDQRNNLMAEITFSLNDNYVI